MKIVFDHQIFLNQVYGGISKYYVELAKAITCQNDCNSKVTIVAPFYRNAYLYEARDSISLRGLLIPRIPRTGKIFNQINNLISDKLINIGKARIIHETYYSSKNIGNGKAKRVITVHDMIHEIFPHFFSPNDKTSIQKKISINRADHIICISDSTKKDLIKILGVEPQKISVVHHGISEPLLILSNKDLKFLKPYILYVGERRGYKNFQAFITAYSNSYKIQKNYDVVCFGGGSFSVAEKKLFDCLKIKNINIKQVSGDDHLLATYYKNASVLIYPSLYEGFGMPPLEAMSYGCPTVCSKTSSMPEVLGDATIYHDPLSIESIRNSLECILFNNLIRDKIIESGYEHIKKYSWKRCAKETLEVYGEII